jgi:hypothetical protein
MILSRNDYLPKHWVEPLYGPFSAVLVGYVVATLDELGKREVVATYLNAKVGWPLALHLAAQRCNDPNESGA